MKTTFLYLCISILFFVLTISSVFANDVPFSGQQIITTVADFANAVFAADLDGDGDLDALSASISDNKVAWYENTDGAGTFGGQQVITTSTIWPRSVIAADIDGDGDIDVLSASQNDNKIAWYENTDGAGTFGAQQVISTAASGAYSIFTGDVDNDGDIDVFSASYVDDKIAWYENTDGAGTFGAQQIITTSAAGAISVYAADIDNDGDLDALSASLSDNKTAWYENTDGAGTFGAQQVISTSSIRPKAVFAVDVDNDGDTDVLTNSSISNKIAWHENTNGAGTFGAEQIITTAAINVISIYAADMDNDGDFDVMSASPDDSKIAWYENADGSGTFGTQQIISTAASGAFSVHAADVDGDGDVDVMSASAYDDKIAWYENETIHRSVLFIDSGQSLSGSSSDQVKLGDINSDGDLDACISNHPTSKVWFNSGTGTFTDSGQSLSNFEGNDVTFGDLDGDGDLDIYAANGRTGGGAVNKVWLNNGAGSFSDSGQSLGSKRSYEVALGDLDGDGDLDAFCSNFNEANKVWTNDGTGTFSDSGQSLGSSASLGVKLGDMDGDGDLDAFVANDNDQGDKVWFNDGTGSFSDSGQSLGSSQSQSVALGDVDKDGDLDAFCAAFDSNKLWLNNGSGIFTDSGQSLGGSLAEDVKLGDLDNDGDLDALIASDGGNSLWLNNATGTFSNVSERMNGSSGLDAAIGDMDNDGDLDTFIVSSAHKVWLNRGGQFGLATMDTAPALIEDATSDDLLKIVLTHNGRTDDTDSELATLELLFEESASDPLTSAEANALIENLYVYLDDGSDVFESGSDTLVATVGTLSLTAGIQTVNLADGDAHCQVLYGTPKTFFVVVELTATASLYGLVTQFRVTHITEASSTAEDRDNDFPLSMQYAANAASGVVSVNTLVDNWNLY